MASQRISMFQNGGKVSRFTSEPRLSGAGSTWEDIQVEEHHLTMHEECAGVNDGYQMCFNIGPAALVHWKLNGRPYSKVVGTSQFSIASHGNLRAVRWHQSMQILLVSLSTPLLAQCSAEDGDGSFPELIEHLGYTDSQIEGLLRLLHSDVASGNPAGPLYGEELGVALAFYLTKRFAARPVKDGPLRTALPGGILKRVCEYVESHLDVSISLAELALQAEMSRFYFSRLFRNRTGQSPSQYVASCRVEKAKLLMGQATMRLPEIARATGFSSQSHFTSIFKHKTGVTPARYRLLLR